MKKPPILRSLAFILSASVAMSVPMLVGATAPASHLSVQPETEIHDSYGHLVNDYYKKVAPQTLLDGARSGILAYLKYRGVKQATLPPIQAATADKDNVAHLLALLNSAGDLYGKRVGKTQLLYAELAGLAESVHDRYTIFLTPQAKAMLNESLDGGNFSGVGLSIDLDPISHYLRVDEVIPSGPAMHAGVEDGDLITAIDGVSTRGVPTLLDSKKLRGKVGTRVRLTIRRNSKTLAQPITITRAVIHDPSVVSRMLPGHIGYVRLSVFGATTGKETANVLRQLDKEGAQAYILDLRDNGGGYLSAAVDVSSNFVPFGGIVSVEDRGGSNEQIDAKYNALPLRPLAVIVNRSTASASEITSGAIQDHQVGVLIGTRTFGKGVVQTIFPLPDGSAIKVTTEHYYTPRGRDINKVGIQPDITSLQKNPRVRFGDLNGDTQLKAAINYINQKLEENRRESQ